MGRRSLDKELVDLGLEAIKKSLGHLSRVKLEAAQSSCLDEDQIMLLYTRVRRLQDYMQLANASSSGLVEIDLTDHDDNLVASCLLLAVGEGEVSGIRRGVVTGKTGDWTKQQASMHAALTVEFANRQIELLPGVSPAHSKSLLVQRILHDIDQKLSRDTGIGAQFTSTSTGPMTAGVSDFGSGIEEEAGFKGGVQAERLDFRELHARATGTPESLAGFGGSGDSDLEAESYVSPDEGDTQMEEGFLLDPRGIRDPRLRKMVVEDMRCLSLCRRTKDYRMASVHLCAVLEEVALEHAMPRASELGLVGPIDSWRLPVILVQLLGDDLDKEDRALLRQLLTSRSQLYPAIHLRNPREVTADLFAEMLQLARQMLACLSMKANRTGSR